jgi:serine phosphatase RsbU (regulator of sigma subunit)
MLGIYKSEFDSILQIKEVDVRIEALNQLAYKTRFADPETTTISAQKAFDLSKETENESGENAARMHLAFAQFILSKDYPILKELAEANQFFNKTRKIPEYPVVLNYLGNVYDNYGEYQKGLSLCHEALKLAQDNNLKEVESDILSTVGLIMSRISDYSGAIDSFKKSLDIRKELGMAPAMASSLNLLARTYSLSNKFELSEQYYQQAIQLRIEINETGALPWSYIGLASLYEKKKEYDKAVQYYEKSLELNNKTPDKRCSLHCYLGLSRIFLEINKTNESKSLIDNALKIAEELNANPLLYEAYHILSKYYENLGKTKDAFESFKKFHQIRDSVLNAQTHSMLKNQQMSFEIEKVQKDAEIHQLRNIELKNAYDFLEKRNREILDSIDYAKNIQNALLPPVDIFNLLFPDNYFIYYNPKDIVSGDFYWCYTDNSRTYLAVADCTGHGVPGAFMSVLGISLLNEIANTCEVFPVDELLNELRSKLIASLRQSMKGDSLKDGLDIAMCCIDHKLNQIEFAGAFNPVYIITDKKLVEIKGDRMPIGIFDDTAQSFTKHVLNIEPGMCIYMFSDGFVDQFGGPYGKKLKAIKFKEIILSGYSESMENQKIRLDDALHEWRKGNEQVDDILVVGVKLG